MNFPELVVTKRVVENGLIQQSMQQERNREASLWENQQVSDFLKQKIENIFQKNHRASFNPSKWYTIRAGLKKSCSVANY